MKAANSWTTYRTRFLVKAKQLNTNLTFTDVLGRQHSGSKGDYLVESSDGILRIASRQIFEDVYVPLLEGGILEKTEISPNRDTWERREILQARETPSPRQLTAALALPSHLTRKSPQPCHDRPVPGLRSL